MHPILAHPARWWWHLLLWAIGGVFLGLIVRALLHPGWATAIAFGLPMGLAAGLLSLSAWYVCLAMPASRAPASWLAVTALIAAIVIAAIWAGIGQAWWIALDRLGLDLTNPAPEGLVPLLLVTGGLAYLVALMANYVWQAFAES